MNFNNKITIITGSAQGIGLAIAHRLFDEGATVILNSPNETDKTVLERLKTKPEFNSFLPISARNLTS